MRPEWVLDASVLAFFLLGSVEDGMHGPHRRTPARERADIDAFANFLRVVDERGDRIVVCPNVWTEISNLFQKDGEGDGGRWSRMVPIFADLVGRFEERHVPSQTAVSRPEFRYLGLTDTVLLAIAATGATLVTNDWMLAAKAGEAKLGVLHFEEIRQSWGSAR